LEKYFQIEKEEKIDSSVTKLGHYKQNLLDGIKEMYDSFNLIEDTEKEKVNGIFYRISESICYIITNVNNIDFDKIDLKQFCSDINEVSQIINQFNSTLILGVKGHYSLISIVKIIEYSQKNNLDNNEFRKLLISFIKNIYDEKSFLLKNNQIQAKNSLTEQLNIAINLSDELCMKIFINKLLQYMKLENYKLELVNNIFEFPQLIKYSFLFFNYIFLSQSTLKPKRQIKKALKDDEKKKDYLDKFGEIKNQKSNDILNIINNEAENSEILKEILIYIFELRIISYFEDCLNSKLYK
jgi:hypothetical protein